MSSARNVSDSDISAPGYGYAYAFTPVTDKVIPAMDMVAESSADGEQEVRGGYGPSGR